MSVSRNPARSVAGAPAYSPDNLPVYRGGSSGAAAPSFDPATLFDGGWAGDYWDATDISTLTQDTAGATPVVSDGDVTGRMNGFRTSANFLQATTSKKPIYTASGSAPDGVPGIYMYNVPTTPNSMQAVFGADFGANVTIACSFYLDNAAPGSFSTLMEVFGTGNDRLILINNTGGATNVWRTAAIISATEYNTSTQALTEAAYGYIIGRQNGTAIEFRYNDTDSTPTTTGAANHGESVNLGVVSTNPNVFFGGLVRRALAINRSLSETEMTNLATWLAGSA